MGWQRAIITDSGGFQVFSLAHGTSPTRSRVGAGARPGRGASSRSTRTGFGFAPTSTGPSASSAPRSRWACRRRSAPTSRWPSTSARRTTPTATTPRARWSERTAGSTAAWPGTSARGPARQAVFGIVQGGVHEDLRRVSAERVSAAAIDGIAIGGTLGRDKAEMRGRRRDDRAASGPGRAVPPAGDRRARRPGGGDRARHRPLRLRGPDPPGATRRRAGPAARGPVSLRRAPRAASRRTEARWSRAVPARPARRTPGRTSTTCREPRS